MKKISALSTGIMAAVVFAATNPVSANPIPQGLEERLLEEGGVRRGICAVLGIDADLSLRLARESGLLVHVRDPRPGAVLDLRKQADQAGVGIRRLAAEQGGLKALPYADNTIDLIIASQANELLGRLSAAEVLRALRPEGIAIIGQRDPGSDARESSQKLEAWADRGDTKPAAWNDPSGVWIKIQKPPLKGADDWSHWEKGPDNNPVSRDQVIKAPYMTQFMANPLYIGMPSITTAAGGRTFLAVGHIAHHRREWDGLLRIIARSGYNGKVLWERKLPQGYLVHRSAFIATKETFYMIDGDRCLMLDAQTGSEQGEIRIPGVKGDWKWMALLDGTLYVLAGKPDPGAEITKGDRAFGGWSWADLSKGYYGSQIPFGFGDTVAAFDLGRQAARWVHREETLIDSRGMAVQGNRMFLYCPESHLRSLDIRSGEIAWTNANKAVLGLIGQPGRGLTSTPGFRTACMLVATPQALIVQGQTRMNVIAVSTETGDLLWQRKKITNNPNAIYVDNKVILGVGERGSHVVVDPFSGEIEEDLKFFKRACTRLTASSDSFFCRGEGTLRFDRSQRKVLIDGAARPACNDGALPANGMLYIGPWQCDCNLSIIGHLGKCSAGAFRFDHWATEAERLQTTSHALDAANVLPVTDRDWPTYRGNNSRSASTQVGLESPMRMKWRFRPNLPTIPTPPTAAGGLVFTAGDDGKIRAIDAADGSLKWEYLTPAPIKQSPSIWNSRAYAGGGDGQVYCLDAATGQLLWRFRAAPVERHIMVYGSLCSTWPAHSGVLVRDGVAYVGAGIIDQDGTYVYALDAETGKIIWQNNSSGHLNAELRKGVSVQGNLSIQGGHLLMAGGNQVSPARYDLQSGACNAPSFAQGQPKANNGKFVGVFRDDTAIAGGRILHSSARNVATKGSFDAYREGRRARFVYGGIPPAWNGESFAFVNFKFGKLTCLDSIKVAEQIAEGLPRATGGRDRGFGGLAALLEKGDAARWKTDLAGSNKFEVVALLVCPNAVVTVTHSQALTRSQPQWWLVAFDKDSGRQILRQEIRGEPLPDGLLMDRQGQVVVAMLDGSHLCFGPGN